MLGMRKTEEGTEDRGRRLDFADPEYALGTSAHVTRQASTDFADLQQKIGPAERAWHRYVARRRAVLAGHAVSCLMECRLNVTDERTPFVIVIAKGFERGPNSRSSRYPSAFIRG